MNYELNQRVNPRYLKKGMRIRLMKDGLKDYTTQVMATVDMDGDAYRVRDHPTMKPALDEKHYINVRFDHLTDSYTDHYDRQKGLHPNDTIYFRDGWEVFVNKLDGAVIDSEIKLDALSQEESKKQTEVAKLQAELAAARATIQRVEKKIGELA